MEATEMCEKVTDEEEIDKIPNGERSGKCAHGDSFRVLKNEEIAGFVLDKSTIDSAIISAGASRRILNMNSARQSKKFELGISHRELNAQAPSIGLDSIGYPTEELFYKGQQLPFHARLRIQITDKLVCAESQKNVLEACDETQTENIGNSSNIYGHNCGTESDCEDLWFHIDPCNSPDVAPYNVDKEFSETYYDDTLPKFAHSQYKELYDSTHSQPLNASKSFVKTPSSKLFNTRGTKVDLSRMVSMFGSIQSVFRRSPNRESPTSGGALLKRNMSCPISEGEDGVQEAVAHCKQSLKDVMDTSKYLQRSTSNLEGYAGNGQVRRT